MHTTTVSVLIAISLVVLTPNAAISEESHPGISREAEYAEAVAAYNVKNYRQALDTLNALLKRYPDYSEALELKALTHKTAGEDEKSLESYQKLLKVKPEKDHAPYHFELGVLYQKKKNYELAKKHLSQAIERNFNKGVSQFFLGTIELQSRNFKKAREHFADSVENNKGELEVASHYYLGASHAQLGYGKGATAEFLLARDGARKLPESALAKDILSAAEKSLFAYDRGQWFGNVSLLTQYDGNVSLLPSSAASPEEISGKKSMKTLLMAGAGRMSSPLNTIQWVGSYRFSYNKNLNTNAKEYEFATNTLSLYLTYKPMARTNFGLKTEGNLGFQNRYDSGGRNATFRPYSLTGEVGPYLRSELDENLQLSVETFLRPQKFHADPSSGATRRSGTAFGARSTLRKETSYPLFNPQGLLAYEYNKADGTDFLSKTMTLDFSNQFYLPKGHRLTLGVNFTYSHFPQKIPARRADRMFGARLNWIKEIAPKWALLADLNYSMNRSTNPELFSYDRPSIGMGVSYTF